MTDENSDERPGRSQRWENNLKMRDQMKEAKRKRREDRRLNHFWRRNETFQTKLGGDDETRDASEMLLFRREINKDVSDGWSLDRSIQDTLKEAREDIGGRRCRCEKITGEENDGVVHCTTPWKPHGVDSVYSFIVKKC